MEKVRLEAKKMPPGLTGQFLQRRRFEVNTLHELLLDDYLHNENNGPYHLARPKLATIVLASLLTLHEREIVYIYAICVMSNHVHAVLGVPDGKELVDVGQLMKSHKGFTGRMCNRILNTTGLPFWDNSYFDRTVRRGKFITVMAYVLNNPVKAGLVEHWSAWPHSWLNPEFELLFKG
jgi:REP element-mobilizing transposase RayT